MPRMADASAKPSSARAHTSADARFRKQFAMTELCTFFAKGACFKKDGCRFAHGSQELQQAPDLRKTSLCKKWLKYSCRLPSEACTFAHGVRELRATETYLLHQQPSGARGEAARPLTAGEQPPLRLLRRDRRSADRAGREAGAEEPSPARLEPERAALADSTATAKPPRADGQQARSLLLATRPVYRGALPEAQDAEPRLDTPVHAGSGPWRDTGLSRLPPPPPPSFVGSATVFGTVQEQVEKEKERLTQLLPAHLIRASVFDVDRLVSAVAA